ncbi:YihY/virulence factor BrkB family protein [Shimia biformata]|uniref:YihY/virulence factor BrkB family protein n=1 Tax=Shimia biformata TaxID=1294299 RepID=UPI0019507B09|nr:YihY/virulence factor BrkB family protein [Shimia biformata]
MNIYVLALFDAVRRFVDHDGFMRCSHIALTMMLALFPFCIFVLSLAVLVGPTTDVTYLMDFVFGSWPEQVAAPIQREVLRVLQNTDSGSLTFGAVFTLFFASNGVEALRLGITRAYRDHDPRPFWRTRIQSLVFIFGAAALIFVSGTVSVAIPLYLSYVEDAVGVVPAEWLTFLSTDLVQFVVLGCALLIGVVACHKFLPGLRRPVSDLMPGILLSIVLWLAGAKAFGFYVAQFSRYSVTYAGLAGVMAALMFLYAMGAIFILGAEFNGALIARRENATADASEQG